MDIPEWKCRTASLLGNNAVETLEHKHIMVFGCGGVGGYVIEGIARAGIGKITAVDFDVISLSNINRQIIALNSTIGMSKVSVLHRRATDINPNIVFNEEESKITEDNAEEIIKKYSPDFICECIDDTQAKIKIISVAKALDIPIISCMGTGNKLHPERFRITDISKTSVCPLAKSVRIKLKKLGITDVPVLWSDEEPVISERVVASVSFVPSVAGFMIAGEAIRRICNIE